MILKNIRNKGDFYTTFGTMWPKGKVHSESEFSCENFSGEKVLLETRATAYWPDGSLKWLAHTADASKLDSTIEVMPDKNCSQEEFSGISVVEKEDAFLINNGLLNIKIARKGTDIIPWIKKGDQLLASHIKSHLELQKHLYLPDTEDEVYKKISYESKIYQVSYYPGKLLAEFKIEGKHVRENDEAIPFIIYLKIGYGKSELQYDYIFFYDKDESQDQLKAIGLVFDYGVQGPLYNRHIKFTTENDVFHETVLPLRSWRPRLPHDQYLLQYKGNAIDSKKLDKSDIEYVLKNTPHWNDYTICQDSAQHFFIKKSVNQRNFKSIEAIHGGKSKGILALGSEAGSVHLGMRDFWQKYPSGYRVKGLSNDMAKIYIDFWSPEAQSMDYKHYTDRGYNKVNYEGYDYFGASAHGVGVRNFCSMKFCDSLIPADEILLAYADEVQKPPFYFGDSNYYHNLRAFGYWSLPSYETKEEIYLEKQLDLAFRFYENEVVQRNWYGLYNYGDFYHTYDGVRHSWMYDIGGYAWDNTELVPTLWLWLYFMRTGRDDVYTLASNLSLHSSEVDVYHFGPLRGLGSRHNVSHWGCPCKEARIAMCHHYRFYYYLTGDRRMGDVLAELKDNEYALDRMDPLRDFYPKNQKADAKQTTHARTGPDWSSLVSNWLCQWERSNDELYRDKILVGINNIKEAPLKLLSGPDFGFSSETKELFYMGERTTGGTHLQICMGAPQIWLELSQLIDDPEWNEMLAKYGYYYMQNEKFSKEEKTILGEREFTFPYMASAMGAFGASYLKDKNLAKKTWRVLLDSLWSQDEDGFKEKFVQEENKIRTATEIPWISTNFTAQFCLNLIMSLEFIRGDLIL